MQKLGAFVSSGETTAWRVQIAEFHHRVASITHTVLRCGVSLVSEKLANSVMRHTRFQVRTRLCYRILGEREWREGTTVNISKSGVLFEAEEPVNLGTRIEMRFSLPVQTRNEPGTTVTCRGVIVRSPGYAMVAARISSSRLVRRVA